MKFAAVIIVFSFAVVALGEETCPKEVQTALDTCFKSCKFEIAKGETAGCTCVSNGARGQAALDPYVSECVANTDNEAALCKCLKTAMEGSNCHPKMF